MFGVDDDDDKNDNCNGDDDAFDEVVIVCFVDRLVSFVVKVLEILATAAAFVFVKLFIVAFVITVNGSIFSIIFQFFSFYSRIDTVVNKFCMCVCVSIFLFSSLRRFFVLNIFFANFNYFSLKFFVLEQFAACFYQISHEYNSNL